MTKVTLVNDHRTTEMEGQTVIAFVLNPSDPEVADADAAVLMLGHASKKELLKTVINGVSSLFDALIDNPVERWIVNATMMEQLRENALGKGAKSEVVHKEMTPIKEDKDGSEE